MSSQNLYFSWLGTIFCCQTQNENSKEKNSDNEEAVPFTKQENCDHQNGGTVEIPLKATKFQKRYFVSVQNLNVNKTLEIFSLKGCAINTNVRKCYRIVAVL